MKKIVADIYEAPKKRIYMLKINGKNIADIYEAPKKKIYMLKMNGKKYCRHLEVQKRQDIDAECLFYGRCQNTKLDYFKKLS